jgi:crossover junction endodeoxyribonuclease RuvC
MESATVIGIDPGRSGGIACIGPGGQDVQVYKLDNTDRDVYEKLQEFVEQAEFAFLEKVHSMPKQGVASTFKFGVSFGFLQGILIASGIPFELVTPQKWQGYLSCRTRGDKNVTKARAQELFPDVKCTHAISDSLLIAEYGRRVRGE